MNNNYQNYGTTRFFIRLASIFGIIMMLVIAGFYFYYLGKYNNPQGLGPSYNQDTAKIFLINSYQDIASYKIIFFIIVVWMTIKTIVCNIGLIRYSRMDDSDLVANKWSLAVLSLSIGGIFTPWMLTWLPNTNVKSTKNARITIVQYMGISWMLGALVSMIGILAFFSTIPAANQVWVGNGKTDFIITVVVLGVVFLLNAIFATPFLGTKMQRRFATNDQGIGFWKFVAGVYTFIITLELIIQIITSILKVVNAFARIFQGDNAFERIFAVINALFTAVAMFFMITLIVWVIRGLWSKEEPGYVEFQTYRGYNQQSNYR